MEIGIGFIRDAGFRKIYNYYKDIFAVKDISIRDELNTKDNLSAFSVANDWGATFGVYTLVLTQSFVEWYKMYYPLIGLKEVKNDQARVLKASKKLQKDFEAATGVYLGDMLVYAPKLEMYSRINDIDLTVAENTLCVYIDTIYRWAIECNKLKKNMSRASFEKLLGKLTLDTKDFFEYLGIETEYEEYLL